MKSVVKNRRPPIDLDSMNLSITKIDEEEANELRGILPEKPISEQAITMSIMMKQGRSVELYAPSLMVTDTTKRLLCDELERIVRGSRMALRCIQKGTTLTFTYVKW